NVLERAMILAEGQYIEPENFPGSIQESRRAPPYDFLAGVTSIKEGKRRVEERLIRYALESTQGNKSQAAQLLEISYPSLLSKIKEYEVVVVQEIDVL
ncbi:MAG: sigma-54-dependent Fis family transcriptional regulator, partial [Candidatus Electrothrix sp. AUS4]|nr:sigma-54-dependent Fis family transcriptional regulator [Candidatus Electrothrix sp. AUS4]